MVEVADAVEVVPPALSAVVLALPQLARNSEPAPMDAMMAER